MGGNLGRAREFLNIELPLPRVDRLIRELAVGSLARQFPLGPRVCIDEPTANQMFVNCLPANAEADGIKVFPIAFGGDAAEEVLARIAAATGGRMYSADPASISNVYISISAEQ